LTDNHCSKFQPGYPEKLYSGLEEGVAKTNSMAAYQGMTITDVMSNWTTQAGHPILHVEVDYENNKVTLTQVSFFTIGYKKNVAIIYSKEAVVKLLSWTLDKG
jgi:aminopeptidase N